MWGEEDRSVPRVYDTEFARRLAKTRTAVTGAGDAPHLEPPSTASVMVNFLKT